MNNKSTQTHEQKNINKIVGKNLKFIRQLSKKNQTQLGDAIGPVKFQQVQKYEAGFNQLSSYRLYKAAQFLKAPMEAFFDPNYISKMHAVHDKKYFDRNVTKPKDFFNVYSYQDDAVGQLQADEYYDIIKGRMKPEDAEWLK